MPTPLPPTDDARPPVVVVGGGITGLATAWFLRDRARVTVLEADGRLGGKIRTASLGGVPVEEGPDTFLARVPHARALAEAVGLGDDLVQPATGKAFIWTRGRLRRLPEGQVMGVPVSLGPLLRSGVLPASSVVRAGLDLVLPRGRPRLSTDPSVAEVIGERMGRGVVDRLVEPLVGGINAGRADDLSLAATVPVLAEAAASSRSLVLGLRRRPKPADGPGGPLFLGVAGGLGRLVERLGAALAAAGVEVRTGAVVRSVEPAGPDGGSGYRVVLADGSVVDGSRVVVTVPAFAAAPMLRSASPTVASDLARLRYASVAVATLAYRPEDVIHTLDGAGFLVPRVEQRLMTACTWSTSKWPALAGSGLVLVRASTGRAGDDRFADLADDELVDRLHRELSVAVGLRRPPVTSLVSRWPDGFPQYQPGHQRRVDRITSTLASTMPGVVVAGAAYRGLGIAACVRQAEEVATAILPEVGN